MNDATLDISEARKQLSQIDKRLKKDRLIWITRHNRKAFAIVNMDLMEALLETLAIVRDPKALKAFQESLRDIRAGRLHDYDEIEREMLATQIQVDIQWTRTAKRLLAEVPVKVRTGIIKKIGSLRDSDPRRAGKPLVGPFQGYRRITHGRYRAIFSVDEAELKNGKTVIQVRVVVVAVGIRKERDKKDIYKVARRS